MKRSPVNITPFIAIEKIKNWCAYQERSQNETYRKLLEYGLSDEEAGNIITELIAENFLNEERFAIAFASGKFRIKHWGKNKIKAGLKSHKVSDYCIRKGLESIDGREYETVLLKTMEKKLRSLKSTDKRKNFYATVNYMVSRGFESDLVIDQLKLILEQE